MTKPTPLFSPAPPAMKAKAQPATPDVKPAKREKIFSKSRDTREDRGTRQAKTSQKSQTLSHGH